MTQTPTPTPTPTAQPEVYDLSDPDAGDRVQEVPDLTGDEADVYNWVATYQLEYWRAMTTNAVSPAFDVIAGPELKARIAEIAEKNAEHRGEDRWRVLDAGVQHRCRWGHRECGVV